MASRFVLPALLLAWNALVLILWNRNFHPTPDGLVMAFKYMFLAKHFSLAIFTSNWLAFLHASIATTGLLVFSLQAGRRAVKILPNPENSGILHFAAGLGLLATAILGLGLNGLLFAPPKAASLFLLLVPLAMARNELLDFARNMLTWPGRFWGSPPTRATKILAVLAAVVVAGGVFSIEIGWDALMYHLRLPSFYVYHHKIYNVWHNYCTAFPANIEILYGLGMLAEGETMARLLNAAFGLLLLGACRQLAREVGLNGRWSVLLLASCPLFLVLMTRAYIDLGFDFFTTVSLIYLVRWWKSGTTTDLAVSGLCAGWGAGSKYVAAVYLVSAVLVLFMSPRPASKLKASVLWVLSALLSYSPWLAKNYLLRGNPVDPFLGGLFGQTDVVPPEIRPFFEGGGLLASLLSALPERAEALFQNHGHIDGPLIPALAGLLPLILMAPVTGALIPVKRFLIIYSSLWFLMTYDVRYYFPALPALCVLGEALLSRLFRLPLSSALGTRILAEAGLVLGLIYGSTVILSTSLPLSMPLGFDSRETKLRQGLTPAPFASFTRNFVNTRTPESARILAVCQHSTWYFDRECLADFHYWESNLTRIISAGRTEEGMAKRFKQLGIGWIYSMSRTELYIHLPGYFSVPPDGWRRFKSFLETRCEVAFQTNNQVIYRIGRPHPPRRIPNLPIYEDLYFMKADQDGRKKLTAEALRAYNQPDELLRNVGSTFQRQGNARLILGDYSGAEEAFRRALASGMDIPDTNFGLAVALFNQQRILDAAPYALRAVEMNPYSVQGNALMGRIRAEMN
jgi:hypothetical protein